MTCPVCGGKTRVADVATEVDTIIRQRVCKSCRYVFYTEETEADCKRIFYQIKMGYRPA